MIEIIMNQLMDNSVEEIGTTNECKDIGKSDDATAKKEAINGRAIFEIKRDDSSKGRIVKQGFRERV
jgi:hypothetical protein